MKQSKCKNRLTLYFREDRRTSLRIYFETLEAMNIFLNYFKRCVSLDYTSYEMETYKGIWTLTDSKEIEYKSENVEHRAAVAPWKLHVECDANHVHDAFEFDVYFFAQFDADVFAHLVRSGAGAINHITLTLFRRSTPKSDWESAELQQFVPESFANALEDLEPDSYASVLTYMQSLPKVSD